MSSTVKTHRSSQPLTFTEAAIAHLQRYLNKAEPGTSLRIAIKQAGCSGWQYDMIFTKTVESTDMTCAATDDITVYIDAKALAAIQGSVVDYIQDGINKRLVFNNPNATSMCGCGESFTMDDSST